jgi:hypothetical protein
MSTSTSTSTIITGSSYSTINKDAPLPTTYCSQCLQSEKFVRLLKCSACKVAYYCCKEHQKLDYSEHKKNCKLISSRRAKVNETELDLRTNQEILDSWGDLFDPTSGGMGHFWGIFETRDYMRARIGYIVALATTQNHDYGFYLAVHEISDCLKLCRGDNMGLRYMLIYYLVILDRDQEAYDFIKWYETVPDEHYDCSR